MPSELVPKVFRTRVRQSSGLVADRWPEELPEISAHPKIRYCISHWVNGERWEAAGAYDYMLERIRSSPTGVFDGCSDIAQLTERYGGLDDLYRRLSQGEELKTMEELEPGNFREVGGIFIHIGPAGEPVFGGGGAHRLAMAIALNLIVPAQTGIVHRNALTQLSKYRTEQA